MCIIKYIQRERLYMRNKSTIAKLLSEEDINVVQKQATTASFDVKNRELVLPIWKDDMSDNIADLLVCHEIGHALYTSENMLNKMIERKRNKRGRTMPFLLQFGVPLLYLGTH